jgi:SM-20-related protein
MADQAAQYELVINGILNDGYGICDNFLNPSEINDLYNCYEKKVNLGLFSKANIGKKNEEQHQSSIRGDKILWIEPTTTDIIEQALLTKIQAFIDYLNKTCYLGITSFEFHYANYENGKFYKRHRDTFTTQAGRVLSVILYLNKNYNLIDGGNLMIYPTQNGIEKSISISPIAGRMVCFESEKLDHEVLETFKDRTSITGWFLNK